MVRPMTGVFIRHVPTMDGAFHVPQMVKNLPASVGDTGLIPGSGRSPGEGKQQPTPAFLPGESRGWRSLEGYSPRGPKRDGRDLASETTNSDKPRGRLALIPL